MAHENFHTKPCVLTVSDMQCIHARSHKLKLPKDSHTNKAQAAPTHPPTYSRKYNYTESLNEELCRVNKSSQFRKFFIPSKENGGATHKEQKQCRYVND